MTEIRARISDRADKQAALTARLTEIAVPYKTLFCYVSMGTEADTIPFIRAAAKNKTVLVPHTADDFTMSTVLPDLGALRPDRYGNVTGQAYAGDIELAVVPLLAFNRSLHRIGYGKGCYDRWLRSRKVTSIGLAFDEQYADFAAESCDVPLDMIVTPTRLLKR